MSVIVFLHLVTFGATTNSNIMISDLGNVLGRNRRVLFWHSGFIRIRILCINICHQAKRKFMCIHLTGKALFEHNAWTLYYTIIDSYDADYSRYSSLGNDFPILNAVLFDFMIPNIPIAPTINKATAKLRSRAGRGQTEAGELKLTGRSPCLLMVMSLKHIS